MKPTIVALTLLASAVVYADDSNVHPVQPTHQVNGQIRIGNQDPDRVIVPVGDWQYCEGFTSPVPPTVDCSTFVAGHEKYRFRIKAKNSSTGAYVFTVWFYRWIDGRTIVLNGTVQRNDDGDGYTNVDLDPGAPVSAWKTDTEEYRQQ